MSVKRPSDRYPFAPQRLKNLLDGFNCEHQQQLRQQRLRKALGFRSTVTTEEEQTIYFYDGHCLACERGARIPKNSVFCLSCLKEFGISAEEVASRTFKANGLYKSMYDHHERRWNLRRREAIGSERNKKSKCGNSKQHQAASGKKAGAKSKGKKRKKKEHK